LLIQNTYIILACYINKELHYISTANVYVSMPIYSNETPIIFLLFQPMFSYVT